MPLLVAMEVPALPEVIEAAAEGLVSMNFAIMRLAQRNGGGFPLLYESGVTYRREEPRHEDWLNAIGLLRQGFGDCEDLAGYRAAELRMDGEPATVKIIPTARHSYHAVVQRANGEIEDPSRIILALARSEES
jgi:hypothetical protein